MAEIANEKLTVSNIPSLDKDDIWLKVERVCTHV